jgi:anti-sigma B factor antagonist
MLRTLVAQLMYAFDQGELLVPRTGPAPPASSLAGAHDVLTGQIDQEGTRTIVVLQGEADFSTALVLSDVLARGVGAGVGDVVVDLSGLEFIDTGATRVLEAAGQRLQRVGRKLTLRSPNSVATRVLETFGLTAMIETHEENAT